MGMMGSSLQVPKHRTRQGQIKRCESRQLCHGMRSDVASFSLKWKPPSENSIDFLLQLKFPALDGRPSEPDLSAKPVFMLMMNHGHEGTHYFDTMEVDDETWER